MTETSVPDDQKRRVVADLGFEEQRPDNGICL